MNSHPSPANFPIMSPNPVLSLRLTGKKKTITLSALKVLPKKDLDFAVSLEFFHSVLYQNSWKEANLFSVFYFFSRTCLCFLEDHSFFFLKNFSLRFVGTLVRLGTLVRHGTIIRTWYICQTWPTCQT